MTAEVPPSPMQAKAGPSSRVQASLYLHIHIYIHIYKMMYTYIYIYVYIYTYIYTRTHTRVCLCFCLFYAYVDVCMSFYMYLHISGWSAYLGPSEVLCCDSAGDVDTMWVVGTIGWDLNRLSCLDLSP